jgi:hypothetical protein
LKKERLVRLTLSFVMTLDHTHLQERDLSLIFSDTSHGNLTLTGVDLAGLPPIVGKDDCMLCALYLFHGSNHLRSL